MLEEALITADGVFLEALAAAVGEVTSERELEAFRVGELACADTFGEVTAGGANTGSADLGEVPAETLLMLLLACMMGDPVGLGDICGVTAFGECAGEGDVSLCKACIAPTLRFGDRSL